MKSIVTAAIALLVALSLSAQSAQSVLVSVVDERFAPVSGLAASDFAVSIDGVEHVVIGAVPANDPLAVVIVPDRIDSASAQQVRAAMKGIVGAVRAREPQALVGAMLDESAVPPALMPAAMSADVDARINKFFYTGEASTLSDRVIVAAAALTRTNRVRRAVILLSIQKPDARNLEVERMLGTLRAAHTSLWTIEVLPQQVEPLVGIAASDHRLQWASQLTGSFYRSIMGTAALQRSATEVVALLSSPYRLTLERGAPSARRVVVTVKRPKGARPLSVVSPVIGGGF